MDLLEISQTLPKGQTTGFDGMHPLRNCNSDGIRSGIRKAGFQNRDLTGFGGFWLRTIVKPLSPTTPKTQKKAKMTQDCKNVALKLPKVSLKLPKISLSRGYFGQFKGYSICTGNLAGFFASEGGSCHRGFTIVLSFGGIWRKPAFESVSLGLQTLCPKEGSAWQATLAQTPSFPSSCARRDSDFSPLLSTPFWVSLGAQILKKIKILKFSSELEIFKRATHQTPSFFCGNSGGQDWKFQARLNISSDLENFKRSWIFSRFGPLGFCWNTPKKTVFTRTFSQSSRQLFPASLWDELGTQQKLF